MALNDISEKRLKTVHPDLVRVFRTAVLRHSGRLQIIVTEGARSVERQKQMVLAKLSQTMNSRHIPGKDGFAKALDVGFLLNGKYQSDWPPFTAFSKLMKEAARELKVPVEWGGDWRTFKDGPHYQLNAKVYP